MRPITPHATLAQRKMRAATTTKGELDYSLMRRHDVGAAPMGQTFGRW